MSKQTVACVSQEKRFVAFGKVFYRFCVMTVIENEVTKKAELNEYTYKIVGREREKKNVVKVKDDCVSYKINTLDNFFWCTIHDIH